MLVSMSQIWGNVKGRCTITINDHLEGFSVIIPIQIVKSWCVEIESAKAVFLLEGLIHSCGLRMLFRNARTHIGWAGVDFSLVSSIHIFICDYYHLMRVYSLIDRH